MDTNGLLNAVARRHKLESNRALARLLQIDRTRITAYRAGRRTLDPDACLAVADALDVPRGYVLAMVQAERAKRPEHRRAWLDAAKRLKSAAVCVTLAAGASAALPFPQSEAAPVPDLYIMSKEPRDRRRGRPDRRRRDPTTEPCPRTLPLIA